MKFRFSFKVKLQLILLAVSISALCLLAFEAHQSSVAFRSGKETQVRTAAEGMIDKIDRNLFERYGDVQAYALSESARSGDPARITDFINDMMATYSPVYDLMMVTDATGKVIAVSTKSKGGEPLPTHALLGADFSKKAWFRECVSGRIKPGASFVEDLHVDGDVARLVGTSGRVMNFSAPIVDKKTGVIIGVWTNRMSWTDVVEAIAKEEAEKIRSEQILSSFPYLLNAKGGFLMHPEGEDYELKKAYPAFAALTGAGVRELDPRLPSFTGTVLEASAKSKGYATYPGRGWTAMLQIPAYDLQTAQNMQVIYLGFGVILIANILAFWVIRRMGASFEQVVAQMSTESAQVRGAANRISTASQQLSESTTEQAAAIEETAASMEEIAAMLGQTTLNTSHCKTLSEEGQLEAQKGKEVILKMTAAMEEIQASNAKLDRLIHLIDGIKNKTKIINDIVSETRLLSFNASIEAARAGVHGKGFAVVAEEVGKLASISGRAADEIRELLESSAQEVSQVVKDTHDRVHLGKSISHDCETAFQTMGRALERVNSLMQTIATASKEQETGIKQTNRAMTEMDKVTQSNSRGAETLSDQASKLYGGAKSLNDSIEVIRLIVLGEKEAPVAPVEAPIAIADKNPPPTDKDDTKTLKRADSRWKDVA